MTSACPKCPTLSGLKHCLWLRHMALKYQDHFRIYTHLFPKFQEYGVLMAAKNTVFFVVVVVVFLTSKGFRKGFAV